MLIRFLNVLSAIFRTVFHAAVASCARLTSTVLNRNSRGRLAFLFMFVLSTTAAGSSTRKAWSTPEFIDKENDQSQPSEWHLAFDSQGNGIALTGETHHTWANYYSTDTGWGTPEIIDGTAHPTEDTLYGDIMDAGQAYFDSSGNAVAVWRQHYDYRGFYSTWTNRYTLGKGWGKATKFDNTPGDDWSPMIVGDARGALYAVWSNNDYDRVRHQLWARIYDANKGWGQATVIAENTGYARMAMIKVDAAGNVYAVWAQGKDYKKSIEGSQGKEHYNVWISRYSPASGWGKAALVVHNAEAERYPQLTLDAHGSALAVWKKEGKDPSDRSTIWAKRYLAGKGWGHAVQLSPANMSGDSGEPEVAFDAQGNALALWSQGDHEIHSARYAPDTGWREMAPISRRVYSPQKPHIAFDRGGNALAVWSQPAPGGVEVVMASHYVSGTGWGEPVPLGENNKDDKSDPQLAMDAEGNAIVVWLQERIVKGIWVNHYKSGKGWEGPKRLKMDFTGSATRPQVVFDARGIAHVSWTQSPRTQGSYRVWTSRYQPAGLFDMFKKSKVSRKARTPDFSNGATPLHTMAEQGKREQAEDLIAKGENVNARDDKGRTPLHLAVANGARDVVDMLIARGAYLNAMDAERCTPLHRAIENGSMELVELLIAKGANVNQQAPGGRTLLSLAINQNRLDLVRLLLTRGANIKTSADDHTLLHMVAMYGSGEMAELFLARGAKVNTRDSIGMTPLHAAVSNKDPSVTRVLLSHGVDVNARRKGGYTPLHDAKSKEVVDMLISKGADINAKNNYGSTPLHNVVRLGERNGVVEALLARGADINAVDAEGKTLLDAAYTKLYGTAYSSRDRLEEIIVLLKAHGVKRRVPSTT